MQHFSNYFVQMLVIRSKCGGLGEPNMVQEGRAGSRSSEPPSPRNAVSPPTPHPLPNFPKHRWFQNGLHNTSRHNLQ